jgi:uncharacterized protein (TIGR02145 family)
LSSLSAGTTYYVAFYSSTASNTTIGNVIAYEHGVVTTTTGRTWMQWNLGATAFPSDNTTTSAMGSLYQWGRRTDGHQTRTNPTPLQINYSTAPKTYNAASIGNKFLWGYPSWLNPQNDHLWQGVNGINNPCPSGYRVPTANEFSSEIVASGAYGPDPAFNSVLKLQQARRRNGDNNGTSYTNGGYYWTSTVVPSTTDTLDNQAYFVNIFMEFGTYPATYILESPRYHGMSVRCIKDYGIINSTHSDTYSPLPSNRASVSAYDCPPSGANGQMLVGVDVSNINNPISQTITANVTELGSYAINAYHKGMTFSGSGTFTGTGSQTITLNAYGGKPPLSIPATNNFYLQSISPSCVFERTVFYPTSYGTANITSFNGASTPGGLMTEGVPVTGVTQNITGITVATAGAGTYSLTTNTVRGVTFTGRGSLTAGSGKNIVLSASGTPTLATGADSTSNIYTLNGDNSFTTQKVTFRRGIMYPSSNGTAIISSIIVGAYNSTLKQQSLTIDVTTIGTINIKATNNGVTFLRAGSYSTTGVRDITLVASGTPTATGTFTFTTNTTPSVSFDITF